MAKKPRLYRPQAGPFDTLKHVLWLIAALRSVRDPWHTAAGLKQTILLLAEFAERLGIDPAWTGRVRAVVADQRLFNVLLAVVQYLAGLGERGQPHAAFPERR